MHQKALKKGYAVPAGRLERENTNSSGLNADDMAVRVPWLPGIPEEKVDTHSDPQATPLPMILWL